MAERIRILRVPRTDNPSEHLLLHIEQKSITKPLDLKLIATDHEHLFHGAIYASKIDQLKAERFTGDDDELRHVLCFCLLQERPDGAPDADLDGAELVVTQIKHEVVLTIRRRLGEITSRIANIKLEEDDEREEVSPFEWLDVAVAASNKLREQITKSEVALGSQLDETVKLRKELEEFLELKKHNDEELLSKFVVLLNSKKQKIRELQTLLRQAGVDADAAPKNKRKAETDEEVDEEDVEMEDGGEPGTADADDMPSTPPATDDEVSDVDDLDDAIVPRSTDATIRGTSQKKRAALTDIASRQPDQAPTTAADEQHDNDMNDEEEFDDEL